MCAITLHRSKAEHLKTLTIANAGTESDIMTSDEWAGYASLGISGPEALTGTVTVETLALATDDETTATNWKTLNSPPGTAVEVPAGQSIVLNTSALPFAAIRFVSSGAEGGPRVFQINGARSSVSN